MNEEFKNVKYLLTSNMRTKIILAVYRRSKNLDELRKELNKPSASILHGLKELETINIVQRTDKKYRLTSNGYLLATNMVKLIENWYVINQEKSFWNIHITRDIPEEILKKIYLLKDVEIITSTTSDLSNAFNRYIKLISGTSKMKIILPIYSENHFQHIIQNLSDDTLQDLELIVNREVLNSIKKNKLLKNALLKNRKVKVFCVRKNLKLFLTCSDSFMSLTLFFKDEHYDDSQLLIGKSRNSRKWAYLLFDYYKKIGEKVK